MPAARALDPQEPVLESATTQICLELIAHELGQHRIALTEMVEERIDVLLDDAVKR